MLKPIDYYFIILKMLQMLQEKASRSENRKSYFFFSKRAKNVSPEQIGGRKCPFSCPKWGLGGCVALKNVTGFA